MGGIIALSPSENLRALRRLAGFDDQRVGFVPELVDGSGGYKFTRSSPAATNPSPTTPAVR